MQKYSDVVLSAVGAPVSGAVITVTTYPDGAAATIYAADGGPSVASVTTNVNGRFSFYAANGHYSILVSGTGITPVTYNDVVLFDPADSGASAVKHGTETVASELSALQLADYAALRAYAGARQSVYVTGYLGTAAPAGIAGMFVRDDHDTTSTDNGGTVIVAANGKRWRRVHDDAINARWFGMVLDGTTDDTTSLQNAISYVCGSLSRTRKLVIPYGASGTAKITAQLVTSAPITIEWENKLVVLKKYFNGDLFSVPGGYVKFINPGIDGNAPTYTGGGIRFSGTSYDCSIDEPRIVNTVDSCVICDNGSGGTGGGNLIITGGGMVPYNSSGMSSAGPAAFRLHGTADSSPQNRTLMGVTSSTNVLADVTGTYLTKIIGCFTGTIQFSGNPNVTGATGVSSCSEAVIEGTYIRDGISISGTDHVINGCITHGHLPIYSSYGVVSGYDATWGWQLTANAQNCSLGQGNEVSNKINNLSPNGLGDINNKYFVVDVPGGFTWTGATANPVMGNGSMAFATESSYGSMFEYTFQISFGSTTTLGTGQWYFDLPHWTNNTSNAGMGTWTLYQSGVGFKSGIAYFSSGGATHRISLMDSAGNIMGSTWPGAIASGSVLTVKFNSLRN